MSKIHQSGDLWVFHYIICHSCITNGQIMFYNDSTHELAGKTIDLQEWNNTKDAKEFK